MHNVIRDGYFVFLPFAPPFVYFLSLDLNLERFGTLGEAFGCFTFFLVEVFVFLVFFFLDEVGTCLDCVPSFLLVLLGFPKVTLFPNNLCCSSVDFSITRENAFANILLLLSIERRRDLPACWY